jgi:hypothetical protein
MTSALILSLAIITSVPPAAAIDYPPPIVAMNAEQPAASSDLGIATDDACSDSSPAGASLLAPVEPICTNWCNDQKVLCCANPYESCNYTCEYERILCTWDCRSGNGGAY